MLQPIITFLMIIATGTLQLESQTVLDRVVDSMHMSHEHADLRCKWAYSTIAILVLMVGHVLQVTIWGLWYYAWGDLGSLRNCLYFSLASFTTVGANDLELKPWHRMAGAVEAGIGMLMFGWSTALLVDIIQRARQLRQ